MRARVLPRDLTSRSDGFVLVGVVMFVLALTILGLSLFALSSYESQFVTRSQDSSQAFDVALSGFEHAKFVLARQGNLEDVRSAANLYLYPNPDRVMYAGAWRTDTGDSIGKLADIPDTVQVEFRVLASVRGERRMIETRVLPNQPTQIYKRLMSITDSLYVLNQLEDTDGGIFSYLLGDQTHLEGEIYGGGKSNAPIPASVHVSPPPNYNAFIPFPDVQSFFNNHLLDPSTSDAVVDSTRVLNTTVGYDIWLSGSPSTKKTTYFRTLTDPFMNDPLYSMHVPKLLNLPGLIEQPGKANEIHVRGRVVWMLPKGFKSGGKLIVVGDSKDCLVIVAGPSGEINGLPDDSGRPGIWLQASLQSTNVPVILVSSGWVDYEHRNWNIWVFGENVNYLTIFAKGVLIEGPANILGQLIEHMYLRHDANSSYDQDGGLIDDLIQNGDLPNSESGNITFRSVPGRWRELDPDDPDSGIPLP